MTTTNDDVLTRFPGSGAVITGAAVPGEFHKDADVRVFLISGTGANKTETQLASGSGYTLTKAIVAGSNPITYTGSIATVAAVATGSTIVVMNWPANTQNTNFSSIPYAPSLIEQELDRAVRRDQVQTELETKTLRFPLDSQSQNPLMLGGANGRLMQWDENGNVIDGVDGQALIDAAAALDEVQNATIVEDDALVSTVASAQTMTFGGSVNFIMVAGHTVVGDRPPVMYVRRGADPGHPGAFQDAGGTWFEKSPGVEHFPTRNAFYAARGAENPDGTEFTMDGFWYVVDSGANTTADPTVSTYSCTGDLSVAGLRPKGGQFHPEQFGATGDGVADDYAALNACIQAAKTRSDSLSYALGGGGGTAYVNTEVRLGEGNDAKVYRISQGISVASARVDIRGNRCVLMGDDFNDYLITFTGRCYTQDIESLTIEATQAGCLKWDADNASGSMVGIRDIRFSTDRHGHETAIGLDVTCRSGRFTVENCYINRVKTPVKARNCDFFRIDDNWIGSLPNTAYADYEAPFNFDKGQVVVTRNVWAGGPSDPDAAGATNTGINTAFINMGIKDGTAPDADHSSLLMLENRCAFEDGAGAIVNWFTANKGQTGSEQRSGFYIDGLRTSPREQRETAENGSSSAFLVRLFEMPHYAVFGPSIETHIGIVGLMAPGNGVNLSTLRANAADPFLHNSSLRDLGLNINTANYFAASGVVCPQTHLMLTNDDDELQEWQKLFNVTNFGERSDNTTNGVGGNGTLHTILTSYTGFSGSTGSAFLVMGNLHSEGTPADLSGTPVFGLVMVRYNADADTVTARFQDLAPPTGSELFDNYLIEAKLDVSGTKTASVTIANAANATLALEVSQAGGGSGSGDVRCPELTVMPISALLNSTNNRGVRQPVG